MELCMEKGIWIERKRKQGRKGYYYVSLTLIWLSIYYFCLFSSNINGNILIFPQEIRKERKDGKGNDRLDFYLFISHKHIFIIYF